MRQLTKQYEEAVAAEREAWALVREKQAGQPGHDPVLWQKWLDAANRVQELAKAIRDRA